MTMISINKLFSLLALATVGSLAIACGTSSGTSGGTAATADTGTATDGGTAAKADTGTATDGGTSDAVAPAGDASAAAAAGCLAAADQATLKPFGEDKAKGDKFADDVKNCSLPNASMADQAAAAQKIGECLVGKGYALTVGCAGCYGIRAYCTIKNCLMNAEEAKTANCLAAPTGEPCTACANKYKCIEASENCKAGK